MQTQGCCAYPDVCYSCIFGPFYTMIYWDPEENDPHGRAEPGEQEEMQW